MSSPRAIIIAAGRGKRLGGHTDEIPKTMVPVAGKPILHWQLDALAAAGVTDVTVIRGYQGHRMDGGWHPLRFVENPGWERNNILASLMHAEAALGGGALVSYADIVYAPTVAAALIAAGRQTAADAVDAWLVIDRGWRDAYEGRDQHPISEAELARVDETSGTVVRVGKRLVAPSDAAGEFIGLALLSARGAAALSRIWRSAIESGGLDAPFGNAPVLRQAYFSDGLNAIIDGGGRCVPVFIDGCWREIDTEQDLAAAERNRQLWTGDRAQG